MVINHFWEDPGDPILGDHTLEEILADLFRKILADHIGGNMVNHFLEILADRLVENLGNQISEIPVNHLGMN